MFSNTPQRFWLLCLVFVLATVLLMWDSRPIALAAAMATRLLTTNALLTVTKASTCQAISALHVLKTVRLAVAMRRPALLATVMTRWSTATTNAKCLVTLATRALKSRAKNVWSVLATAALVQAKRTSALSATTLRSCCTTATV